MEHDNSDTNRIEHAQKAPESVSGETQSDSHPEVEKERKTSPGAPDAPASQPKLADTPEIKDPLTKPKPGEPQESRSEARTSSGDAEGSPGPKMPLALDVASAKRVEPPPAPVTSMPEIARAGVRLTEIVLLLIGIFLAVSLLLITVGEAHATSRANRQLEILAGACAQGIAASPTQPSTGPAATESLGVLPGSTSVARSSTQKSANEKSIAARGCELDAETTRAILAQANAELVAFRAFALDILKTVLLNVLLPVLTALLGYVFGSSRGTS